MTLPTLRDLIDQHFSDEELSQLCLDLSIKYDNLPGDTHIAKAQSLVEHCLRHNCLPQLGRRCRELRPRITWPDTDKLAAEWQAAQEKQTRLHAVFTGDELAEMLEPWQEKETAILTQLVGGDQITVGDMTNSIAAVGRNAQVHITGNIYYGKPADNPQEALRIYREVLAAGSRALPLRGVDVGVSDPAAGQNALELAHVYIDLDTKTSVGADDLAELKIGKVRLWAEGKGLPVDSVTVSREKEAAQKEKPLPALTAAIIQRQLILLGDPGGGKTTFVRHLAHCLAAHALHPDAGWLANLPGWPRAEADILPVMVILRDFARSLPSPLPEKAEVNHLWQFIETRLKAQNLEFAADAIHDKLEAGEALLLLDGLDEVPSKEQRVFVRDAAAAFAARYPDCRALVTCRVLSYQPPAAPDEIDLRLPANKFPVFELAPFDDEKIDRFIAAWYQELARADVVAQEDAAGLTRKLQKAVRRPDLWRLAPNPLLLTVMALVHTHKGRLPDARALLYEETIDILLWRWEQIKAGGKEDAPQLRQLLLDAGRSEMDLKKLLWRLAYEAHSQVAGDADGEKLADIGELKLTKALAALKADDWNWGRQVVETMKLRAGLLLERAPGLFTFPHRTFQEYLAGAHLAAQAGFSQEGARLAEKGALWREVTLLAVGRLVYLSGDTDKPLALAAELCPAQKQDDAAGWTKAWLAGDVLLEIGLQRAQDSSLGRELRERARQRLAELAAEGKLTPRQRAEAGKTLAQLGDPRPGVGVIERNGLKLPDIAWGEEVPAGTYTIGGDKDAFFSFDKRAAPIKQPYRLSRYPITNAQFQCFVDAPDVYGSQWWEGLPEDEKQFSEPVFPYANHPRERVSWYQAVAFCRWLSDKLGQTIQLPHEYEWEVAARWDGEQADGRSYPWGDKFDSEKANTEEGGVRQTTAVGIYPSGKNAALNLYDLSGNVWEWCRNKYNDPNDDAVDQSGKRRVVRGGSWNNTQLNARAAYRSSGPLPGFRNGDLGVRVVVRVVPHLVSFSQKGVTVRLVQS